MTAAEKRLLRSMLAEGCGVSELFAVIDAMLEVRNVTQMEKMEAVRPDRRTEKTSGKGLLARLD